MLYRCIQELIKNVIKHAKASKGWVSFNVKDNEVIIKVSDDGVGMNIGKLKSIRNFANGGFGIFSIKERIQNLDGRFTIESSKGKGTKVELRIPI